MSEIQSHLEEIYHTEVSKELISIVTDGVIEEVTHVNCNQLLTPYCN